MSSLFLRTTILSWFLTILVLVSGGIASPASAQAGLNYATYNSLLGSTRSVDESLGAVRQAGSFDLRDQGGSVVYAPPAAAVVTQTARPEVPSTAAEEPQRSHVDRSSINIVAEVGIRARIAEFASDPWQPRGMKHVRVSVELARPGKHIVPYVAVGRWDNLDNRNYSSDQFTPAHTTFAVLGLAIRSNANPQAGQIVFQANAGFGRTWGRDQRRTTARHVFEGTVSVSYHFSRRVAIRAGYAHYSTGEGVILHPGGYFRNLGEGRLTLGLTLRV